MNPHKLNICNLAIEWLDNELDKALEPRHLENIFNYLVSVQIECIDKPSKKDIKDKDIIKIKEKKDDLIKKIVRK